MVNSIKGFKDEYRWLSNFWYANIMYNDIIFPTVEHAYVASKTLEPVGDNIEWFLSLTPGEAKKVGRQLDLRPNFDNIKVALMLTFTREKYSINNPILRDKLEATGGMSIVEENSWGDLFWGMDPLGRGANNLGKIIMQVREENRND